MLQADAGEVVVEFAPRDGATVRTGLAEADAAVIVQGHPVRRFASYAGKRHYSGWWWSSTVEDLVGYESLLERDRLLVADFDTGVDGIASQPFGISGRVAGKNHEHVPDYLLLGAAGPTVVDVKPQGLLDRPEVREILQWTSAAMTRRGWRYEVWTGEQPRRLENLRFLAQGRRPRVDDSALQLLRECGSVGAPLAAVLAGADRRPDVAPWLVRSALLRLLWLQEWVVDLSTPLTGDTKILRMKEPS